MQGTAMHLPLTDTDCDNLVSKIKEAVDQIDASNPDGTYRPLVFIDLQDELAKEIRSNGGLGDDTLRRLHLRHRDFSYVLFSSFDLLGHARRGVDPSCIVTTLFLYTPSYVGEDNGRVVNLRPAYIRDIQRHLGQTRVVDWQAGGLQGSQSEA